MKHITKKEFKELASVHVYGKGERRRVRLFFDWNNDPDKGAVGFKYMLQGRGITKETILRDAYNILILNDLTELCWYDYKEAKTDAERFKVPICG